MSFNKTVPKKEQINLKNLHIYYDHCLFMSIDNSGFVYFNQQIVSLIYLVLKLFEVDSFLWLMVTGTRDEHLPWAHKHQLSFLFYYRDHHRNSLNKNGEKNNNLTATFSHKLNLPPSTIFIKETGYLILCYDRSSISAWFLCIAKHIWMTTLHIMAFWMFYLMGSESMNANTSKQLKAKRNVDK